MIYSVNGFPKKVKYLNILMNYPGAIIKWLTVYLWLIKFINEYYKKNNKFIVSKVVVGLICLFVVIGGGGVCRNHTVLSNVFLAHLPNRSIDTDETCCSNLWMCIKEDNPG